MYVVALRCGCTLWLYDVAVRCGCTLWLYDGTVDVLCAVAVALRSFISSVLLCSYYY